LTDICAAGLELIEVRTLLSQQEYQLIGQAIQLAFAYWKKKYPDDDFMFIGCEEIEGHTFELHRRDLSNELLDWREEKTWHIVMNRFTDDNPDPIKCHTLVHYHPERPADASLTVEEA